MLTELVTFTKLTVGKHLPGEAMQVMVLLDCRLKRYKVVSWNGAGYSSLLAQ